MTQYSGRLGLQQRVLPGYRVPFFDLLAGHCDGGMSLFAGSARRHEMITNGMPQIAKLTPAHNVHLLGGPFYLCYQKGFIRWLEEWNPDVLIAEANPRYLATPFAMKWMHARGRKVIGWGLGAPSLPGGAGFIRQFDAMISYSQRGADEYAALGFPRENIFVAHNAVSPTPTNKPDHGQRTIPQWDFVNHASILFVGRLQSRKRVDHLIRACAEISPGPRLVIVGDGPERDALKALANEVYPSAEFIGARHGAELDRYFAEADLFVLPGTGGLAVQEAMSHGLPVIVAKGDGTQDDLVREANGWQIPADHYDSLVRTMKNALSDTARLKKMGDESFRIVSEEINIQKMADVFIKAVNSV